MQPVSDYDGELEGRSKQVSRKEKEARAGDVRSGNYTMLDRDG